MDSEEKRSHLQSGRSCRFSPSWHSQRILEWDSPEEAAAPAPPKNQTNKETETWVHDEGFLHPASSQLSFYPGCGGDTTFRRTLEFFPSLLNPLSLLHPVKKVAWIFQNHTLKHTQTNQWPSRTWRMLKIIDHGKENSQLGLMKSGTDFECLWAIMELNWFTF